MRWPAALALLAVSACGGTGTSAAAPDGDRPTGTLTVFAAASLTDALGALATGFEAEHPGLRVVTSFAGSASLAAQVAAGAPVDVLATADRATMARATDAPTRVLARNRLQIAVPAGNAADVTGLADLARDELAVALCAVEVPCGAAAAELFRSAGVQPAPDTLEQDVRAVLTKVRLDEVDAGVVYRTDVLSAAGEVEGIDVQGPSATYPVAVLPDAPNPLAARAFVAHVLSPEGQRVLADAGFDPP